MADEFRLKMPDFHVTFRDVLHAVNLRHGTDNFTYPPKEGMLRIFFALKNPTASVGFEPANVGTKGQHATSRPPKPPAVAVTVSPLFRKPCFTGFPVHIFHFFALSRGECWNVLYFRICHGHFVLNIHVFAIL